jgi:type IV pilus assembly protein PilM
MLFQRRTSLGFDIGMHSVKSAVVEVDRGRIRTLWAHDLDAANDPIEEALLRTRLSALAARLAKDTGPLPRTAVGALQGNDIYCQYLELPKLSNRELETAVPAMARKHVPIPLDSVSLNWLPVPPIGGETNKSAVFILAARKEAIQRVQARIKACGMEAQRLDVVPLALVRQHVRNHEPPREPIALVHSGYDLTTVVVVRERYPYYVRDVATGGRSLTYAWQMGAQNTWGEAEQARRGQDVSEETEGYTEPFLRRWLDEVSRTIDHFHHKHAASQARIQQVVLSGGMTAQPGLVSRLSAQLRLPVVRDAWDRLRPEGAMQTADAGLFKIAVGLALEE